MAKKAASSEQEKKRKTRKRAVLQFRIPEAEYRELAKVAAKGDLTISEEAARRLLAFPQMEREANLAERYLDSQVFAEQAAIERERRGNRRVVIDLRPSELGIAILTSTQIEDLLARAAKMGAELALKSK